MACRTLRSLVGSGRRGRRWWAGGGVIWSTGSAVWWIWTVGSAPKDRRGRCGGRDVDQAARVARGDPLVGATAGRAPRGVVRLGRPDLAEVEAATLADRDVQVLHRPGVGRQGA